MKFERIHVDGRTIEFVRRDGGETPIVCLGGLMADPVTEACFFARLPRNYQVISLVLRGHGKTEHPTPYPPEECAADLLALIAELKIVNPMIFAMSFGGLIACLAAPELPTLRGMIIVGTAPFPENEDTAAFLQSIREGTHTFEIHVPATQPYLFHKRDLEDDVFVRTALEYYKEYFPKERFADIMLSYLKDFPIPFERIRCPVGAVINLRDRLVAPEGQIDFARKLGAKVYALPHSGHVGQGEFPQEILANVVEFELNECHPFNKG